ncbi:hypothetical protein EW145_g7187 [Phellinidium pouzarii]|uniref:F-box domain-containing protein n=1 Tax=Phellinidium pouzarii TaxID=167371 RepID=A0A4S4KMU7_9AGAM|nr:hypothetical protein EW145_g7187 [Phellinidium pouzarii]
MSSSTARGKEATIDFTLDTPGRLKVNDKSMHLKRLCRRMLEKAHLTAQEKLSLSSDGILLRSPVQERNAQGKFIGTASETSLQQPEFEPELFCEGINSLPDEILSFIFVFAYEKYLWETGHLMGGALALVSRRFRRIALDIPILWTYYSNHCIKKEQNEICLQRSRNAGLHIGLFITPYNLDESVVFFLNTLTRHAHRWRTLIVHFDNPHAVRLNNGLLGRRFPGLKLPSLTSMTMIGHDPFVDSDHYFNRPDFFGDWDMPNLHSLTAVTRVPVSRISTLKTLRFCVHGIDDNFFFNRLFDYLNDIKTLQILELVLLQMTIYNKYELRDMTAGRSRLLALTDLSLDIFDQYNFSDVMTVMTLPVLERLKLTLHFAFNKDDRQHVWSGRVGKYYGFCEYDSEDCEYDSEYDSEDDEGSTTECHWFTFINDNINDFHNFDHLTDIKIKVHNSEKCSLFFLYDIFCRCHHLQPLSLMCPKIKLLSRKNRKTRAARDWVQRPLPLRSVNLENCTHFDGRFVELLKTALGVGDPDVLEDISRRDVILKDFSLLKITGRIGLDANSFLDFLPEEKIEFI